MVAAYADLAKALKATHKSVSNFQVALSGADPERAADLLRDMPKLPSFDGDDGKAGKKVSIYNHTSSGALVGAGFAT